MKKEIDFLTRPTEERLRREMNNIHGSYSHPWDVLAELVQNSVDAIRSHIKKYGEDESKHSISITVDQQERSVRVHDSGIGIEPDKISDLLSPHGSDKSKQPGLIGEKGVGLTYVIFSSNDFQIKTRSMEGSISGNIQNASLWRAEKSIDRPKILLGKQGGGASRPNDTYTEIVVRDIGSDETDDPESIFRLGFPALACVLRTKTAIGSTWEEPEPIEVRLTVVNTSGKRQENEIPFRYMYPKELIDKGRWLEVDAKFVNRMAASDDRAKSKYLQGKCLSKTGFELRGRREIRYSAFLVPTRKTWEDINQKNHLVIKTDEGNEKHLYTAAIEVATKGMPTAVTLDPPTTGQSGYWPNMHFLIQDDSLPFDIGRKSIPSSTKGLLRKIAREVFNELSRFAPLMRKDPPVSATLIQIAKNERFDDLKKLPNLAIDGIPYLKQPDEQECAVVALFHELAAVGHLKGYRVLKTGYKETYDLWGQYEVSDDNIGGNKGNVSIGKRIPIVIEFKYKLDDILADFGNNVKQFQDIDLLVCWDLDDGKFSKDGFQVEPVGSDDVLFHGTNYRLSVPSMYNLGAAGEKPVISLRRLTEDLAKNKN